MKVAVGLSGGVDSSVAAALLKEQGHDVLGILMRISDCNATGRKGCYGSDHAESIRKAGAAAKALGIPFHVLDLKAEYRTIVLEYFKSEYMRGRTPNPCLRCNPRVKFGAMLDKARESGINFDKFATGHYVRTDFDAESGRHRLMRAMDPAKDQSYGLIFLSQEQLANTLFPLGDITKNEVRRIARDMGLQTHDAPDSQDFYGGDLADLIREEPKHGDILDTAGNTVGSHNGIWNYTVGQRRGLAVPGVRPMYVKAIDAESNAVIVGERSELYSKELVAGDVNYVSVDNIESGKRVGIRIRHTQDMAQGTAEPLPDGRIRVRFDEPQWAIAPGQAVALYEGDMVLAGGIIE
ncbi:MAG: tRNA 2-thiouridine(34) synthase MnmA [Thermoplasmata archaeon]